MKDFTGQRFYKLTAIRFTGRTTPSRNAIWELRCDCGNVRFSDSGSLTSGKAKSCGCFLKTQFVCRVEGCGRKAHSRDLCDRHYKRLKATGDVAASPTGTSYDIKERFSLKTRRAENGCLEWTGATDHFGYGITSLLSVKKNTHRLAWETFKGAIPIGLSVLHRCDNPRCVDVNHLFLGTQKDNVQDCIRKGRFTQMKRRA